MSTSIYMAACRPLSRATRRCTSASNLGSTSRISWKAYAHMNTSYQSQPSSKAIRCSVACCGHRSRARIGRTCIADRGCVPPPPNIGGSGFGGWGEGGAFGGSRVLCALASVPPSTTKEDVILLDVTDMMCGGCVSRVRRVLEGHQAVTTASVNLATETALVRVIIGDLSALKSRSGVLQDISSELTALLSAAGFGATVRDSDAPASAAAATILRKRDERAKRLADSTTRLIISWTLAITCFAGHLLHCWPGIFYAPAALRMLASPALHAALSVATLIGPGRGILMDGGEALLKGRPDMNSLVALGALSALGVSAVAAAVPALGWRTFFEEPAMLLSVVLLGRTLEERAKLQASADMVALYDLLPSQARLVLESSDSTVEVPADAVSKGDLIRVLPGDRLPVDGVVVSGRTTVDEAALTGEPMPVVKAVGETVTAGTVNVDGVITVRSEASGGETSIADIVRSVEGAQARTAPVQRTADTVAGKFAFAVMGLSAATFAFWATAGATMFPSVVAAGGASGSFSGLLLPLQLACNVLVVACPCALGLATPTAVLVGTSAAAKRGLLVRGGDVIERMSHIDTVVFDKTGTLTEGKPSVVDVCPVASGNPQEVGRVLAWAAAVEGGSNHPLAQAVVQEGRNRGVEVLTVEEGTLSQVPGLGIAGVVNGTPVAVGNAEWLAQNSIRLPKDAGSAASAYTGATRVYVAAGGKVRGHIDLLDRVRPGAVEALKALQAHGLRTVMLTGDSRGPAEAVGAAVGIPAADVFAGVRPQGKQARVESLQSGGNTVAMVGDGINDASALAAADVGIAMAGGVQAAGDVADVVLLRDCPTQVVEAFSVSRATLGKIRENLAWAFGYNLVGIPVAAGALLPGFGIMLSPSISGALMGLSSLAVMGNSLLLRREATRKIVDWTPPTPLLPPVDTSSEKNDDNLPPAGGTVAPGSAA